jgi:hypothetical protein
MILDVRLTLNYLTIWSDGLDPVLVRRMMSLAAALDKVLCVSREGNFFASQQVSFHSSTQHNTRQ